MQRAGVVAAFAQVDAHGVVGIDRIGIGFEDFGEKLLELVEAVLHRENGRRLVQAGTETRLVALALVGVGHALVGLGVHGIERHGLVEGQDRLAVLAAVQVVHALVEIGRGLVFLFHDLGEFLDGLVEAALAHEFVGARELFDFDCVAAEAVAGHAQVAFEGLQRVGADHVAVAAGGDGPEHAFEVAFPGDHDRGEQLRP
ncbi:hypothetical protein DSECCO2_624700 [anaerobic digester metagenome]